MANFYGSYIGYGAGGAEAGWAFGGESYGYHYSSGDQGDNSVNRISFTSVGNSVDTGANLGTPRSQWVGVTGQVYGYCVAGYSVGGTNYDIIEKIPYASDGSMSDVGDLLRITNKVSSSNDAEYGYIHGGNGAVDDIERFQMVATANSADVGDLALGSSAPGGNSDVSGGYGYVPGRNGHGTTPSATQKQIDRYQMVASSSGADVGDMFDGTGNHGGGSSATHGYQGGCGETDTDNVIQKNNFAASVTSVDVGNLTVARFDCTGTSSTTYAYMSAGLWPDQTTIDRFSFSSDGNATDVGELSQNGRYTGCTGSQY